MKQIHETIKEIERIEKRFTVKMVVCIVVVVASFFMMGCSEADNEPKFDCAKALKEAETIKAQWQYVVHGGAADTDYAKELKQSYIDAYHIYTSNCK